jgi:hypothetical protein
VSTKRTVIYRLDAALPAMGHYAEQERKSLARAAVIVVLLHCAVLASISMNAMRRLYQEML